MPVLSPDAYAISYISSPATTSDVTQYKSLRLLSLRTDPQFFGSTYEREVACSDQEWKDRLGSPGKATLVGSINLPGPGRRDPASGSNFQTGEEEIWRGTVTILGPSFLNDTLDELIPLLEKHSGKKGAHAIYTLVAVWVDPSFRGKGLAKRLVDAALSWARNDPQDGNPQKSIVLRVHPSARGLYLKSGFRDLGDGDGDFDTELWMVCQLN